jgi:hypothetical protein
MFDDGWGQLLLSNASACLSRVLLPADNFKPSHLLAIDLDLNQPALRKHVFGFSL